MSVQTQLDELRKIATAIRLTINSLERLMDIEKQLASYKEAYNALRLFVDGHDDELKKMGITRHDALARARLFESDLPK
jgi:hypothetical protein